MRARKIVKWGNSMAIRIPKVVLRDAGLQEGDVLVFGAKNGSIVAKPIKKKTSLSRASRKDVSRKYPRRS